MPHNHTPFPSRTCKQCGHPIANHNEMYCSLSCKHAFRGTMPPLKACPVCGVTMPYRDGEPPHKYRLRKTCSRPCSFVLTRQNQQAPAFQKVCVICSKPFARRDGEGSPNFRSRKTCSHECKVKSTAQSRRAKYSEQKVCASCGKAFRRRKNEVPSDFKNRRACSQTCGYVLAARTKRENARGRQPYPVEFNRALKDAIRKRDGNRCRLCGKGRGKRDLHIHHINYDKQDCQPENLVALCASCHCKTHTRRPYWTRIFRELLE